MEISVKRTSNHSEQGLFREEVLSFTREICACAHLTQTRDAQKSCAEMRNSVKNMPDSIFFTRLFVPQASQSSLYRRTESEIQFAIPSA